MFTIESYKNWSRKYSILIGICIFVVVLRIHFVNHATVKLLPKAIHIQIGNKQIFKLYLYAKL